MFSPARRAGAGTLRSSLSLFSHLALALAAVAVATACSSSDPGGTEAPLVPAAASEPTPIAEYSETAKQAVAGLTEDQFVIVKVSVTDKRIRVDPFAHPRIERVVFDIVNQGQDTHEIVVVASKYAIEGYPIEDDRVRLYKEPTDGSEMIFYTPDSKSMAQVLDPGAGDEVPNPGISIAPGETKVVVADYELEVEGNSRVYPLGPGAGRRLERIPSDTYPQDFRFAIFSNLPGEYQAGIRAMFTIRDVRQGTGPKGG